jgi:hypothetical protein
MAVVAVAAALTLPLAAQTLVLKANIPFEFSFAGRTMPAGEYLFQADAGSSAFRMRNLDANVAALGLGARPSVSGMRTESASINFNRYGNTYFLSSMENGYTGAGFELPVTQTERELARTASAQKYEIVAVLARR